MRRGILETADDCIIPQESDFHYDSNPQPWQTAEGAIFIPACGCNAGLTLDRNTGSSFVMIALSVDDMGLFVNFTPEGARAFAGVLLEQANAVEGRAGQMASAAIEAARKSGGGQ